MERLAKESLAYCEGEIRSGRQAPRRETALWSATLQNKEMFMDSKEKARTDAVRRKAARRGYKVLKSRKQHGGFMLFG